MKKLSKDIEMKVRMQRVLEVMSLLIIDKKMIKEHLLKLKEEMKVEEGKWNGDESNYQEEQSHIATEIIEKVDELLELINEFNGTN
jgi:hypothetical protein